MDTLGSMYHVVGVCFSIMEQISYGINCPVEVHE